MKIGTQYTIISNELSDVKDIHSMGEINRTHREFLEANGYTVAHIYNLPLNEEQIADHEAFYAEKEKKNVAV